MSLSLIWVQDIEREINLADFEKMSDIILRLIHVLAKEPIGNTDSSNNACKISH